MSGTEYKEMTEAASENERAEAEGCAEQAVKSGAETESAEKNAGSGEKQQSIVDEIYDEKGIKAELKINQLDLYAFLMYHSYCSTAGIIAALLSVFCLVQGIVQVAAGDTDSMTAVLIFIGVWFLVFNPLTMLGKSATQLKQNPSMQKPITYIFTDKGMIQQQGDIQTGCRWNQITKAVFLKRIWILYAGKVRGSILPVEQLGEHQETLKALIKANTGKKAKTRNKHEGN